MGTFFLKGVGVFDFDYLSQALLQLIFLSSSWLWFNIYSMVRSGVCYMWITTQDRGAVMTYCFLQTLYFELIQVFIICHPWFVCVFTDQLRKNIYLHIVWIRSQVSYSEHDTLTRLGLPKSLFHRDFFNVLVLN